MADNAFRQTRARPLVQKLLERLPGQLLQFAVLERREQMSLISFCCRFVCRVLPFFPALAEKDIEHVGLEVRWQALWAIILFVVCTQGILQLCPRRALRHIRTAAKEFGPPFSVFVI